METIEIDLPTKFKVNVKTSHLAKYIYTDHNNCPLAVAIKEQFPGAIYVSVGDGEVTINNRYNYYYSSLQHENKLIQKAGRPGQKSFEITIKRPK